MAIIVAGWTCIYFMFFGRSLLRPFIFQNMVVDKKQEKREGWALILLILLLAGVAYEGNSWLPFVGGVIAGYALDSDSV